MGRYWGYGSKTTTDGLLWLDMVSLKKFGYLKAGVHHAQLSWKSNMKENADTIGAVISIEPPSGSVVVDYTVTDGYSGEKKNYNYKIQFSTTTCNYGGNRYWFLCPLTRNGYRCGRRSRKLYCYQGYFGCRDCLELCYACQNESAKFRSGFLKIISDDTRAEELFEKIKVPYYNGKPTRKMRRYLKLHGSAALIEQAWFEAESRLYNKRYNEKEL